MDYERQSRGDRPDPEPPDQGPSGATLQKRLFGPVGIRHGKQVANEIRDQKTVMHMLDNLRDLRGGNRLQDGSLEVVWPLPIAGKCHPVLWTMILRAQNHFYNPGPPDPPPPGFLGAVPDGVVDPGGRTEDLMKRFGGDIPPFPASNPKEIAKASVPLALRWVEGAAGYLERYRYWRLGRPEGRNCDPAAAEVHLHVKGLSDRQAMVKIDEWRQNYQMIAMALRGADRVFVRANREEALAARLVMNCWGVTTPAWALPNDHVWFGPDFLGLGPNCRAAILVHECGHYIKAKIGHTGGERGPAYDRQSADNALCSAYVCANFATHAATGKDERYGLARPQL